MIKVLIIDDEPSIRIGLEHMIPWIELGFNVIGVGVNGIDGLEKIETLNPDLVILDMEMPGLNGVDVLKKAKSEAYKFKSIVLTGHSEFKYAKECISLDVHSYLLKPLDEDELIKNLKEIKEEINKEIKTNNIIVNEKFKELILESNINNNSINYNNYFCTNIESATIAILTSLSSASPLGNNSRLVDYLKSLLSKNDNIKLLTINGNVIIIFNNFEYNKIYDFLTNIIDIVNKNMNLKLSGIIGKKVDSIYNLNSSYNDAISLLDIKSFFYDNKIISKEYINSLNLITRSYKDLDILKINSILESNSNLEINNLYNYLKNFFYTSNLSEENIKCICSNELMRLRLKYISHLDTSLDIPSNYDLIREVFSKNTLYDLLSYIIDIFTLISNNFANKNPSNNIMEKMIKFIKNNYKDDLKLETLGRIFNYNSSYLGKTFKTYTGEKFTSYLDKVRIEKAKEFLANSDLKVYEVSREVGFNNIDYFSSKFKKYVGVSPKEFKKNLNM